MEHFYSAYGLRVASDFALPELLPLKSEGAPDITLELFEAAGCESENPPQIFRRLGREKAEMAWPDVGRFHLEAGRRVKVEPAPGVSGAGLRAFLLGPVLSTLLYQRGFLVLHASSVALQNEAGEWGAIGFLGHSGEGKSTMAAAFHARGHRVMGDDVIAIPVPAIEAPLDSHLVPNAAISSPAFPMIFPAFPQLRLWPQSVEALGEEATLLPLLFPGQERRLRRVSEGFEATGVPLRALFALERGEEVALSRLAAAPALLPLLEHLYCQGLREPRAAAAQFQKCGALARTVPVWSLQRPRDLKRLGEVAALVETNGALW